MEILHVLAKPPKGVGGQETYVQNLIKGLIKYNIKCDVLTADPQKKKIHFEIKEHFKVYYLKYIGNLWGINPIFNVIPFFKKFAKNYDIIHVHSYPYFSSLQSMLLSKLLNIPVILTLHGGSQNFLWKNVPLIENIKVFIKNYIFDKTFGFISIKIPNYLTSVSKMDLSKNFFIQRKNNFWIPNAVDTNYFKKMNKGERKYITFIGRLSYIKGFDIFLKIIKKLRINNPYLRFLIIGDGELKNLLEDNKLQIEIEYFKFIPYHKMRDFYNKTKLLLVTSRFEGLPTTILEAMACEVPIVSTNVGGIPDLIKHGHNGYLFDPKTPENAVTFVEKIIKSENIVHKFVINSKNIIDKNFTWESNCKKTYRLYKKMLNEKKS